MKTLNCWSPVTSPNLICDPPKTSPLLVTPTFTGGRPSRNIFSNVFFLRLLSATSVCCSGAWKSMIGPGAPKSALRRRVERLLALERLDAVIPLVVADERDPGSALVQHDRRPVAAERRR